VAVIGSLLAGPRSGAPPRVVLGVDGRPGGTTALGFAFRAAAQRDLPVTAVHARTPDLPADHEGVCGSPAAAEVLTAAALDRALSPVRRSFPHVPFELRMVGTDPAGELVRASAGAAMLVVGSRGRGALRAGLFGSVSRSVLRQAPCPVVVVRPDRPARPGHHRSDRPSAARSMHDEPPPRWGVGWG
jgi:nucleotide-binding universal stress UspA family protein